MEPSIARASKRPQSVREARLVKLTLNLSSQMNSLQRNHSREHNLWCAIPTRRYIFGHEPTRALFGQFRVGLESAREAEIANLELAVGVDEQVA